MALDKNTLKLSIVTLLNQLKDYDESSGKTQADAINKFATDLSNAIDTYVKSGTVITNVNVTGVVAGPSSASGVGTGSIS